MKILALSDIHGGLPHIDPELVKQADALVISGDICPDYRGNRYDKAVRQRIWLEAHFHPWLDAIDVPNKLYTWGNHDWISDEPDLNCYIDREVVIVGRDGVTKRFWFSPWSNRFMDWHWMAPEADLAEKYAQIPDGVDVIVSHGPPFGMCDEATAGYNVSAGHLGSRSLLSTLYRVKPALVVCGHIHGGYGSDYLVHEDGKKTTTHVLNAACRNEGYELVNPPVLVEI